MASGISYLKYTESGCNWNTTFSITNIYEVSYDIASNTSIVHVDFQSVNTGTRWDGTTRPNAGILRVDVDGQQTTCAVSLTKGMTTGDGRVLGSGSANFTISHNTDGSRSVTYSIRMEKGTDPNNYNCVWQTTDWSSGTLKLTTIPRTSNVSLNKSACTLNGGDGFVIYTNRASSSFSHNIYHNIGGSWVLIASGVGDNYTWIPSTNFYANIGNGSGTYKILCETYSGSTHIGDSEASFTLNSAGVHQCSLNVGSIVLNGSNSVRIYTNRNSTSFLHYIEQDFSGTMAGINSDYNCTDYLDWTPPLSLYNTIAGSSKSFTIRVHCKNNNGTYLGYTDVSFKITSAGADTVSMSSTNMTMEAKYSVNIAKKVDAFRHTISWSFGSQSGILGTEKAVDASVDWTPVIGLSSEIPSAMTGSGTVTCETYYGTTLIGSTTVNFNLSVPSYNVTLDADPVITETGKDNTGTLLTAKGIADTEVVAIMSIKRLVVSASTKYNATIKSITVSFGGTSKTANAASFDNTFNGMLNAVLTITAIDSRNRTLVSTYSHTYVFRDYFLPSVASFDGDRTVQTGDTGTLTASGSCWHATAGTTLNEVTAVISQAASGTASVVYDSEKTNNWSTNFPISGVDSKTSYDFTITVTDSFGYSASKKFTLSASIPVVWRGKNTVRIRNFLIVGRVIKTAKLVLTEALTGVSATFSGTVKAPTFEGDLSGNATTASSCTGNSATATNANYASTVVGTYSGKGGQQGPSYYGKDGVGFLMSDAIVNGNSGYKNWMYMDNYYGDDAGGTTAIGLNRHCPAAYILQSDANRSSWNNSAEVITTYNLVNSVYPVGSVYMSTSSTSPASLFGGSWSQITGDYFPLMGSGTPKETGGSWTTDGTAITVSQMPSHTHGSEHNYLGWPYDASGTSFSGWGTSWPKIPEQPSTDAAGGGAAHTHTHIPRYYRVYAWVRVS